MKSVVKILAHIYTNRQKIERNGDKGDSIPKPPKHVKMTKEAKFTSTKMEHHEHFLPISSTKSKIESICQGEMFHTAKKAKKPWEQPLTGFLLDVLPRLLPEASPVSDAGAGTLGVRLAVGRPADDLDPEHPVGEIAVVEGETEVPLRGAGVIGVHDCPRVEQIRIPLSHDRMEEDEAAESEIPTEEGAGRRTLPRVS